MIKRVILFLLIAGIILAALPSIDREIVVKKWWVAGPFLTAPRDVVPDYLWRYGGERNIVPSSEQVFYSVHPDGGQIHWFVLKADSSTVKVKYPHVRWDFLEKIYGWVGILNVGYAWAEIEMDRARRALILTRRTIKVFVNGKAYEAEPYGYRFSRIPVVLEKGKNRILVKFFGVGNPWFEFKLLPAEAEVVTATDYTSPDIVEGKLLRNVPLGVTLINTTLNWQKGLKIEVKGSKFFYRRSSAVPPMAPLSVMKVPVFITQRRPISAAKDKKFTLVLRIKKGKKIIHTFKVPLRIRKFQQAHKKTFISSIDGSVQYYAILYPENYNPSKKYSLILSIHGAGVEAYSQAQAHSPKDWAFVISPTNRRPFGFDWQDWGRLDLMEVLELAKRLYPVDENRIYLLGHSMGGQGTWHNGLHYPSLFAAIAPGAGWTSFQIYTPFFLQRSEIFASPRLLSIRDRVLWDCNNPYFLLNAKYLPAVVTQGGNDDNVPPIHPRIYQFIMRGYGYEFKYREIPGKPHWWSDPKVKGIGADCVDNPEIMEFLKAKVRNPYPRLVEFRLVDLSINNKYYWVEVVRQERVFDETWVRAEVAADRVKLTTRNVQAIRLHLPRQLLPSDSVEIVWNGRVYRRKLDRTRQVFLQLKKLSCLLVKRPDFYGPVKAAFFKPFVIVYGTKGSPEEREVLLHNARNLAFRFWRRANGFVRILPDREVDSDIIRNYNLILLGSPDKNYITEKIASKLPIRIRAGAVELDGREIEGKDLALVMVYPNPLNPEKLVALFAGTSLEGERLSLVFQPIYSASGVPDFIVFSPDVRRYGWAGVKAAGFFSLCWDFNNRDYYVKQ